MYAESWKTYADRGWYVFPLPKRSKFPPPAGVTGWANDPPTRKQMLRWAAQQPDANIGARLPLGVIALDIDVYHGGDDAYAVLLDRFGDLPETWSSSSNRGDYSGHYYYTVPRDTRLVSAPAPGIELIQHGHRYSVVAPSIHPEGRRYVWTDPDGHLTDEIPYADDFPWLPVPWLLGLAETSSRTGTGYTGSVEDWLDSLPDHPFAQMHVREYNKKVAGLELIEGGRHDTMVRTVNWLVHCGAEGNNVRDALLDLEAAYIDALAGERDGEKEFHSALAWAIANFGSKGR